MIEGSFLGFEAGFGFAVAGWPSQGWAGQPNRAEPLAARRSLPGARGCAQRAWLAYRPGALRGEGRQRRAAGMVYLPLLAGRAWPYSTPGRWLGEGTARHGAEY